MWIRFIYLFFCLQEVKNLHLHKIFQITIIACPHSINRESLERKEKHTISRGRAKKKRDGGKEQGGFDGGASGGDDVYRFFSAGRLCHGTSSVRGE